MKTVLGLAILASICFAIAITAGQAAVPIFGDVESVWLARLFGFLTIGLIDLWRSPGASPPLRWLPLLGLMGCLDVAALVTLTAAAICPRLNSRRSFLRPSAQLPSFWRDCS